MSEAKFTKGPWRIDESCWDELSWSIDMGDHHAAATVVTDSSRMCSTIEQQSDRDEELQANAHLIAAAPEMYEMLQDVLSSTPYELEKMADEIKALLAKARGES